MMIKATRYTRDDGCAMHYVEEKGWVLTCHPGGPSYSWDEESCKWLCVATQEYVARMHDLYMSYAVAMERLQTIQHVSIELARARPRVDM